MAEPEELSRVRKPYLFQENNLTERSRSIHGVI
jgi:hypothetical protein